MSGDFGQNAFGSVQEREPNQRNQTKTPILTVSPRQGQAV